MSYYTCIYCMYFICIIHKFVICMSFIFSIQFCRVDSCESKVEVVTPYWASNSVGKTRAIVNTEHFEQAIHQEVCT